MVAGFALVCSLLLGLVRLVINWSKKSPGHRKPARSLRKAIFHSR